jgi:hypothetical protein
VLAEICPAVVEIVGRTALPAGEEIKNAVAVVVSLLADGKKVSVATIEAVAPEETDEDAAEIERASEYDVALADTAEIPPIAKAAAATSATRLKAVFVDIIFLSKKVDWEHFSLSAWSIKSVS